MGRRGLRLNPHVNPEENLAKVDSTSITNVVDVALRCHPVDFPPPWLCQLRAEPLRMPPTGHTPHFFIQQSPSNANHLTSNMKIALIGAAGQLGSDLRACLTDDVTGLTHDQIEITEPASVDAALSSLRPDVVINAAAYNQVDRAEDEPDAAYAVNAIGPRNLARYCSAHDATLVHVSTDYVFGADATRNTPYAETDAPGPLGKYAISKLAGEEFVRGACPRHFVIRTCGLYSRRSTSGNFVKTMLRLAVERDELRIVDDQHCTPTASEDLAGAIKKLIGTQSYGLFHATSSGATTWHDFAREIFRLAGISINVVPITSAEYPTPARRPTYSVLDTKKLSGTLGCQLPAWQNALARFMAERRD